MTLIYLMTGNMATFEVQPQAVELLEGHLSPKTRDERSGGRDSTGALKPRAVRFGKFTGTVRFRSELGCHIGYEHPGLFAQVVRWWRRREHMPSRRISSRGICISHDRRFRSDREGG